MKYLIVAFLFLSACHRGHSGDAGPQGPTGAPGKDAYYVPVLLCADKYAFCTYGNLYVAQAGLFKILADGKYKIKTKHQTCKIKVLGCAVSNQ